MDKRERPHRRNDPRPVEKRTAPIQSPDTRDRGAAKPTHWGGVAEWYDELVGDKGSEYQREVIIPGVLRLLNIKQGQTDTKLSVLDLGCGQGVLCRKLARAGCDVVGIDAAEPLIAAARRRSEEEKLAIRYEIADATKLIDDKGNLGAGLKPASMDAVTIVLAIQNMTPLTPVWQACRAVLKPGGTLILVMMHPSFRVPRQSDWAWQESDGGWQGRIIRQYLTSEKIDIETHPGLAAAGKNASSTAHFHRPLQAYVNTLGNAGLLTDHIGEWISHKISQAGPKKAALDRARKEIPLFMAIRARSV